MDTIEMISRPGTSSPAGPGNKDSALIALAETLRDIGYEFATVTPETHRRVYERAFDPARATLRDVFGWSRPFEARALPETIFDLMQAAGIAEQCKGDYWRSCVRCSTLNGEIFIHSAFPTTASDAVFFGPDTYRFVSALDRLIPSLKPARIADIGAGSGVGGILAAKAFPNAETILIDINEAALRLSRINAAVARADRVTARHSDLLKDVAGDFDLVISNPPYLVDALERRYRHGGGPLGFSLSLAIIDASIARLRPGGTLLLYTGSAIVSGEDLFKKAAETRLRAQDLTWNYRETDPDVFGEELANEPYRTADRIAAVVLTVKKPGDVDAV